MSNSSTDETFTVSLDSVLGGFEIGKLYGNSIFSLLSKPPINPPKKNQFQDLQETKKTLEKELDEARIALSGSCENVNRLKEEYKRLKDKADELTNHDLIISRQKAQLEKEYDLLAQIKFNSHDKEVVDKNKFQYKCLRNLMQVRFSFNTSVDDTLEGYVFNKTTKAVSWFSISTSKLDSDQVQEQLMKLMKKTSHPSFADVSSE